MGISVKNYTNRYLVIAILLIMAVWALLFYAILMDEVYDNIDDGLKNQKIEIIREAYRDPSLIANSTHFGINQFRINETEDSETLDKNHFSKQMIYMPYDEEEEPYRVLSTGFYGKDSKPYQLEIRTSTVEEDDFLINLAISLSVLYVVIILSIVLINHLVLRKAWKPFKEILSRMSRYRFGESESYTPYPSQVREFEELNLQIQKMIDRNEHVFAEQKRFLENAAHELQTPLAIGIGKLELLIQDPDLQEAQLNKLVDAKKSLQRMVALNKSLLTLSRIENKQYQQQELVSFNAVLHRLLEELFDIYAFKGIQVDLQEDGVFEANCNPQLLQILLSNLLRNAIKYNKEHGVLRIRISEQELEIANSGLAEALNPAYIFERFHKGNQDSNSNGLGLSIVQSILQNYPELQLTYRFEQGLHCFLLKKNK